VRAARRRPLRPRARPRPTRAPPPRPRRRPDAPRARARAAGPPAELSDDEDNFHPNIDNNLMIRLQREKRQQREKEEEERKKALAQEGTIEAKDELEKLERMKKLHVGNICQDKFNSKHEKGSASSSANPTVAQDTKVKVAATDESSFTEGYEEFLKANVRPRARRPPGGPGARRAVRPRASPTPRRRPRAPRRRSARSSPSTPRSTRTTRRRRRTSSRTRSCSPSTRRATTCCTASTCRPRGRRAR
jgi:hypothetical protein